MEELGLLWDYEENLQGIDELKQKLMYTSLELESVRIVADEEIKKSKQNATSLLNLLKVAYQERDEARGHLQKLLGKLESSPPVTRNSSIAESNSHNSSSVSSFFDPDNVVTVAFERDPLESLLKGRVLPARGRLLQAVMDAGPLLSNLMVAGPLPRWRNPPPLQGFKIPPVSGVRSYSCFDGSSQLTFRSGPCLNGGRLLTSGGADTANQIALPKRQRLF